MRPVKTLLLAATLAGAAVPVLAQGGAPPGGGGGGFNPAAFMKFREQHKYTFQLSTTTGRGLMECERTPQTRIKPDQAKKIIGVLTPLKKKPKLTQDEAKAAIKKLQVIFDGKQLTAVDKAIQSSQRRPGGGGPGGGAPGGGGPGGGAPGGGAPGGAPGGGAPGPRGRQPATASAPTCGPRRAVQAQKNASRGTGGVGKRTGAEGAYLATFGASFTPSTSTSKMSVAPGGMPWLPLSP